MRNASFRLLRIVTFQEVESVFEGSVARNASFRRLRIVTLQEVESVFEGRVTPNASFRLLPPLGFYNIKGLEGSRKHGFAFGTQPRPTLYWDPGPKRGGSAE